MVFRGIGRRRAAVRIASLVATYSGVCGVLWGLGLSIRGPAGYLVLATPLALLFVFRLWSWHRVSAEVADGYVCYEGSASARDFRVALADIESTYFDPTLPGAPLVLSLRDGDERVCGELSPHAARALAAHLSEVTR